LKDMPVLGLFRSSQENQSKINQISSSQGGAKNVEKNIIHDIQFSHVKVRNQPPPPSYPAVAKAKRIQGTVDVLIVVDPLGTPIRVDALTGPPELLVTAIRYALKWEFEPQRINGLPVSARFKLIMPFKLSDNPLLPMPKN
jgi:TonB family protein